MFDAITAKILVVGGGLGGGHQTIMTFDVGRQDFVQTIIGQHDGQSGNGPDAEKFP